MNFKILHTLKIQRSYRTITLLLVLTLAALACNLPGGGTPAPDATQAVQTIEAAIDLTASAQAPASATPTPAESATATLTPAPSLTATSSTPMMMVSVDTNCRVGPGNVYPLNGAILVGEKAVVVAHDPSGNYWYIENPDSPGSYCWAWGEYATISGDTSGLPVFTPPPTPTPTYTPTPVPNFSMDYYSMEECIGWIPQFVALNTGGLRWESFKIVLTDQDTSTTLNTFTGNEFNQLNGCLDGASMQDYLDPGVQGYFYGYGFVYDPAGHQLQAVVTLCSADDQGGTCITKNYNFTP